MARTTRSGSWGGSRASVLRASQTAWRAAYAEPGSRGRLEAMAVGRKRVSKDPGSTTRTFTPNVQHSWNSASLMASIACLVAAYQPDSGNTVRPATLESCTTVPARARPGGPSLEGHVRRLAAAAGVDVAVRIEPRLAANAAAGEHTVFLADRSFGAREALRIAVHEVLGHIVAAFNGRAQPLRLLSIGTAGSFEDQEGLAIYLEEQAGLLDPHRVRTLAARVMAAAWMHDGASFDEVARRLLRDEGFDVAETVALCERAFRGGGVARDVVYLRGWLRVRAALAAREATVDEVRWGRVGVADVPALRALAEAGWLRPPPYTPSLARSLRSTEGGTRLETSPPSLVTSLTRFEAT